MNRNSISGKKSIFACRQPGLTDARNVHRIIPLSARWLKTYRKIAINTFTQTFERHNSAENMERYISTALNAKVLEKDLDVTRSLVFLACLQGQAVGYIKLNLWPAFTHPVDKDSVELERIYVSADWKGNKIGALLMDKAFSEAQAQKARFLWLGVWEKNNDAIGFYNKLGFVTFGSHAFFLGEDKQNDLLMRYELL